MAFDDSDGTLIGAMRRVSERKHFLPLSIKKPGALLPKKERNYLFWGKRMWWWAFACLSFRFSAAHCFWFSPKGEKRRETLRPSVQNLSFLSIWAKKGLSLPPPPPDGTLLRQIDVGQPGRRLACLPCLYARRQKKSCSWNKGESVPFVSVEEYEFAKRCPFSISKFGIACAWFWETRREMDEKQSVTIIHFDSAAVQCTGQSKQWMGGEDRRTHHRVSPTKKYFFQ